MREEKLEKKATSGANERNIITYEFNNPLQKNSNSLRRLTGCCCKLNM